MKPTQEFRLPSVDSLEQIEGALETVFAYREHDIGIHATALDKRRGALRDAAYLQILLTWARLSPLASLNLLSNTGKDVAGILEEACGYSVGIAAIAVAAGVKVQGQSIAKFEALRPASSRINDAYEGQLENLVKGRTVDLLSVSGAERQFLKPLFYAPKRGAVKDKFDLKGTVRALAMRASQARPDELDEGTISALSTLTHELFENTQEHATTNLDGQDYRRHVELMTASWVVMSDDETRNDLTVNQSLREYWEDLSERQKTKRQVAGICFSFVDSGPGMAARLKGREYFQMDLEEERAALHECLRMRGTSKSEKGTGGGFNDVLDAVSEARGFIRIRSGRLAIFRCFPPDKEIGIVSDGFQNWFGDDKKLQRVAGTLVSVFIPFPRPVV
jgi:hypothetical protein